MESELLARFGSPLFVLSEAELVRRRDELLAAFRAVDARVVIAWSMKTNPLEAVTRVLRRDGIGVELAGEHEYRKAREIGFCGGELYVNGPLKADALLERAIADGAALHADSLSDLGRIERAAERVGRKARVALRLGTGGTWSRFGLDVASGAAAVAAHQARRSPHVDWSGIACHLGTRLADASVFRDAARALADFCRTFRAEVEYVDLGGGFASGTPWGDYAAAIDEGLAAFGPARPRLVLEPGRALVASCGTFLATVGVKKRLPDGRTNLVVDGGVNLLYTAFGERHPVRAVAPWAGPRGRVLITGPVPMNEDVLADEADFPLLDEGDAVAFADAGAYNLALWWQFITYRPAVILVGANGEVDVVREAETYETVTERERIPRRLR